MNKKDILPVALLVTLMNVAQAEVNMSEFREELSKGKPVTALRLYVSKNPTEAVKLVKDAIVQTDATPKKVGQLVKAAIEGSPSNARLIYISAIATAPDAHDEIVKAYYRYVPSAGATLADAKAGLASTQVAGAKSGPSLLAPSGQPCIIYRPAIIPVYCGNRGYLRDANGNVMRDGKGKSLKAPDPLAAVMSRTRLLKSPNGSKVLAPNGAPVIPLGGVNLNINEDGLISLPNGAAIVDSRGNTIPVRAGGYQISDTGAVLDKSGVPLIHDGSPVLIKSIAKYIPTGNLVMGPEGSILKDQMGNPVKLDSKSISAPTGSKMLTPAGILDRGNVKMSPLGIPLSKNGAPLLDYNGAIPRYDSNRVASIDNNELLHTANGAFAKDSAGNLIRLGSSQSLNLDASGALIRNDGQVLLDVNGNVMRLRSGIKGKARSKVTATHKVNKFGQLVDKQGELLKDANSRVIQLQSPMYSIGKEGEVLKSSDNKGITESGKTANWNPLMVDGSTVIIKVNDSLALSDAGVVVFTEGTSKGMAVRDGNGSVLTLEYNDGYLLDSSGTVSDLNGQPLLSSNGQKIQVAQGEYKVMATGELLDSRGQRMTDRRGNVILVKEKSKYQLKGGKLVSERGVPVKTLKGEFVDFSRGKGFGVDNNGHLVKNRTLVRARDNKLIKVPLNSSVDLNSRGYVIAKDGQYLKVNGANVETDSPNFIVGQYGLIYDQLGNPIVDGNGGIVKINSSSNYSLAKNGDILSAAGVVMKDSRGRTINVLQGEFEVTANGRITDSNGKIIKGPAESMLQLDVTRDFISGVQQYRLSEKGLVISERDGLLLDAMGRVYVTTTALAKVATLPATHSVNSLGEITTHSGMPILDEFGQVMQIADIKSLALKFGSSRDLLVLKNDGSVLDSSGKAVIKGGKPIVVKVNSNTYVGGNGVLVDADGDSVADNFGVPISLIVNTSFGFNSKGMLVNVNGVPLQDASENFVKLEASGGKYRLSKNGGVVAPSGNVLTDLNGAPIMVLTSANENKVVNGIVQNAQGKVIKTSEGNEVSFKSGSNYKIGANGVVLEGDEVLTDEAGIIVKVNQITGFEIQSDGSIIGSDGALLLGDDGQIIRTGLNSNVKISNHGLLMIAGVPVSSKNGAIIKLGHQPSSLRTRSIYTQDGTQFTNLHGEQMKILAHSSASIKGDGAILDAKGVQVLDAEGAPISLGDVANPIFMLPDGTIIGRNAQPVVSNTGNIVKVDTVRVKLTREGNPITQNGIAITNKDGKMIKLESGRTQKNGMTLNSRGIPVTDSLGRVILAPASLNYKITNAGQVIYNNGAALVNSTGSNVFISGDGNLDYPINGMIYNITDLGVLVDGQGNVVPGMNGQPIQLAVNETISLSEDGSLVEANGAQLRNERGEILRVQTNQSYSLSEQGILSDSEGKPLKDAVGKVMSINGSGVVARRDGTFTDSMGAMLRDEFGNIIKSSLTPHSVTQEGKIVSLDGNAVKDSNGRIIEVGRHSSYEVTKDGSVVSRAGVPVNDPHGNPIKVVQSNHRILADGTLVDSNGNLLFDQDGKVIVVDSGSISVLANGKVVNGDGVSLLDKKGMPILIGQGSENQLQLDGTVVDMDGSPVLSLAGQQVKVNGEVSKTIAADGTLTDIAGFTVLDETGETVKVGGGTGMTINENGNVLDDDGKPVVDSSGDPIKVNTDNPNTVLADGTVTDINGNPVKDVEGLIVKVGKNTSYTVSPDGKVLSLNGKQAMDQFGEPIILKGTIPNQVLDDGTVVDVNGAAVKDSSGKAVKLGKDSGLFVNNEGNVIDKQGQVVKDEEGKALNMFVNNPNSVLADGTVTDRNGDIVRGLKGNVVKVNRDSGNYINSDFKVVNSRGESIPDIGNNPIFVRGLVPNNINPDGLITDVNGNPVYGSSGKVVKVQTNSGYTVSASGTIIDVAEQPVKNSAGDIIRVNTDIPHGVSIDGSVISFTGSPVLDSDGKMIKLGDGSPNKVLADGRVVDVTGAPIFDSKGVIVKVNSPSAVLRDGTVTDQFGSPVKDAKGKIVKAGPNNIGEISPSGTVMTSNGLPISDREGEVITGIIPHKASMNAMGNVTDSSGGYTTTPDGKIVQVPFADEAGKSPYTADGRVDSKGRIVDTSGNVIQTSDGRPIVLGSGDFTLGRNGEILGKDGKAITDASEKTVRVLTNSSSVIRGDILTDGNGSPVKSVDGKNITIGDTGNYSENPDGLLINKVTGRVLTDEQGNVIVSVKSPAKADVDSNGFIAKNGQVIAPDGTAIVGQDSKPIQVGAGKDFQVNDSGQLVKADGTPVTDNSGKPIMVEKDSSNTIAADGTVLDPLGNPITNSTGEIVKVGFDKPFGVGEKGVVVDINGQPVRTEKGELVKVPITGGLSTNQNGQLVDSEGKPVLDTEGQPVLEAKIPTYAVNEKGIVVGSGGEPLVDNEGNVVALGNDATDFTVTPSGSIVDTNGNPVLDSSGEIVKLPSNTLYRVLSDGTVVGLNGKVLTDNNGEIVKVDTKGDALIDSNGNPLTDSRGKLLKTNEVGQIVDEDGRPLSPDKKGQLTDAYGKVLKDSSGNPLTGNPYGKLIDPVTGETLDPQPDGTLVGSNGKTVVDSAGKPIKVYYGKDPLPTGGSFFTDSNGNVLTSNTDGYLVDAYGNPIEPYRVGFNTIEGDQVSPGTDGAGPVPNPLNFPSGGPGSVGPTNGGPGSTITPAPTPNPILPPVQVSPF